MERRIWLITGVSSGLGKALAQTVMERGDVVIGTFRRQEQTDNFNRHYGPKGFGFTLDLTQSRKIAEVYQAVIEKFGRLDVLVNNAGFGLAGAIEETNGEEVSALFDVNFFAALQMTQAFLPLFRKQQSGHIIQISSHGGFKATAGFGIYNATKFALEGFSEALAQEVQPLGIKLTIVQPGPFRTHFAGAGFKVAGKTIEDYSATAGVFRSRMKAAHGNQEGDPRKAAAAIFDISCSEHPPLRLPLGRIALQSLEAKLKSVQHDIDNGRHIAAHVVYDDLPGTS
jgi:short-subunit dehydrogenase